MHWKNTTHRPAVLAQRHIVHAAVSSKQADIFWLCIFCAQYTVYLQILLLATLLTKIRKCRNSNKCRLALSHTLAALTHKLAALNVQLHVHTLFTEISHVPLLMLMWVMKFLTAKHCIKFNRQQLHWSVLRLLPKASFYLLPIYKEVYYMTSITHLHTAWHDAESPPPGC